MAYHQTTQKDANAVNNFNASLQMVYAKKRKAQGEPAIITSKEVAQLAGVSVATVSRVVNSESNVRETTREKVLAAINKLGYVPNEFAKQMAIRRHALVA